eukprot:scaffold1954_cov268-Pinguiococcus_pyrenoidosus.AAC.99
MQACEGRGGDDHLGFGQPVSAFGIYPDRIGQSYLLPRPGEEQGSMLWIKDHPPSCWEKAESVGSVDLVACPYEMAGVANAIL